MADATEADLGLNVMGALRRSHEACAICAERVGEEVVLDPGGDHGIKAQGQGVQEVGAIHRPLKGATVLAALVQGDRRLGEAGRQILAAPVVLGPDGDRRQRSAGDQHRVAVGVGWVTVHVGHDRLDALGHQGVAHLRAFGRKYLGDGKWHAEPRRVEFDCEEQAKFNENCWIDHGDRIAGMIRSGKFWNPSHMPH